ncbi:hypothetical protein, partial [Dictyobacter arantiisoli]|uniref:hypothetical protein n=1 Tax=Dictyobacter arantiisoli TaxID=2014874 RepID=UPI001C0EDC64
FEPRFVPLDNISICESWRWFTSYFTSFSSFRVLRRSMDYLNRIGLPPLHPAFTLKDKDPDDLKSNAHSRRRREAPAATSASAMVHLIPRPPPVTGHHSNLTCQGFHCIKYLHLTPS